MLKPFTEQSIEELIRSSTFWLHEVPASIELQRRFAELEAKVSAYEATLEHIGLIVEMTKKITQ